jgi:hypothetical protein
MNTNVRVSLLQLSPSSLHSFKDNPQSLLSFQTLFREAVRVDPNLVFVSPGVFKEPLTSRSQIFKTLQELVAEEDVWLFLTQASWNHKTSHLVLSPEGDLHASLNTSHTTQIQTAWARVIFDPSQDQDLPAERTASLICLTQAGHLRPRPSHSQILCLNQGSALYRPEHRIVSHRPLGDGFLWADLPIGNLS